MYTVYNLVMDNELPLVEFHYYLEENGVGPFVFLTSVAYGL